jgi:hypothetical protein
MRAERRSTAGVALAAAARHRHARREQQRRGQWQADSVVELHLQIGALKVGGQQLVLGLKHVRTSLDQIGVECAAVPDLLNRSRCSSSDA